MMRFLSKDPKYIEIMLHSGSQPVPAASPSLSPFLRSDLQTTQREREMLGYNAEPGTFPVFPLQTFLIQSGHRPAA